MLSVSQLVVQYIDRSFIVKFVMAGSGDLMHQAVETVAELGSDI